MKYFFEQLMWAIVMVACVAMFCATIYFSLHPVALCL